VTDSRLDRMGEILARVAEIDAALVPFVEQVQKIRAAVRDLESERVALGDELRSLAVLSPVRVSR
jgi:hypothetical protein